MFDLIQPFDESVLRWIAQYLRTPLMDAFMGFYTTLGNRGMIFIAVTVLMILFRATRKAGAASAVAMLLGLFTTNLTIKPLVSRPRPWIAMPDFVPLLTIDDPYSFPSGHSCNAFAFAVAVCCILPQKWAKAVALAAAALMALSRLYVGVHFPSDVLAGTLIGSLCGLAGGALVRWVSARWKARKGVK